ncbi:MAG: TetR/AcrR family transcriptional regulator [Calditrichaeota bacterium]|nr:MAG: TetR/AcrR family transcriptional regulator [Calditrichota bacterium]
MLKEIDRNLPRKEREKRYKRREILMAALKVFAQKGYEQANIEEVAVAAEFSKGALYNYFSHKEEMFTALLQEGFADFEEIVQAAMRSDLPVREQYRTFALRTLQYFDENPDFFTLIIKENLQMKIKLLSRFREQFASKRAALIEQMAEPLRRGIKQRKIRDIDPVQLVEVFWNIIFAFLLHSRCAEDKPAMEKDVDAIVAIFFDGIELA